MAELGLKNKDDLMPYCQDPSHSREEKAKACVAIGFVFQRDATPVLISLLKDADVALGAANALATIGAKRATRPLMDVVRRSNDERIRHAAISALGRLHDRRSESLLASILLNQDETDSTRTFAAAALIFSRTPKAFQALAMASNDPSPSVRWQVMSALGLSGRNGAHALIREHLSDDAEVPGLPSDQARVSWSAATALQSCRTQEMGNWDRLTRLAIFL